MATMVCSPMKEVSSSEITKKPHMMEVTRFPVSRSIPRVKRASSPCRTIATASIREPMIKKTASLAYDWATVEGAPRPKTTCSTAISSPVAGRGTASEMMRITTITVMIKAR